jgi:predicted PolB exonuclease-like 3'-5' exonuclease
VTRSRRSVRRERLVFTKLAESWACLESRGFDGGEVERYFREGKIKEIAGYCETDVINTYQVWLRYELFRGTLSRNEFEASERNLASFITVRQSQGS